MYRGCLPTRVSLQDKGVHCPLICVTCDDPYEYLQHVFFASSFAMQVWLRTGLWDVVHHASTHSTSFVDTILCIVQVLPREDVQ